MIETGMLPTAVVAKVTLMVATGPLGMGVEFSPERMQVTPALLKSEHSGIFPAAIDEAAGVTEMPATPAG